MIIYMIFLSLILFFTIFTHNYKKEFLSKFNTKKVSLSFFYGTCLFIYDLFCHIKKNIFKVKVSSSQVRIKKTLSIIHGNSENIEIIYGLTMAKRISFAYIIFLFFIVLGALYNLSSSSPSELFSISRPDNSDSSKQYSLIMTNDAQETEELKIDVQGKIYAQGESILLFQKYHDEILKKLLGNNSDIENIREDLFFFSQIGDEHIELTFVPENTQLITYDGSLVYENIPSEGIRTDLEIQMKLDDFQSSMFLSLTLFPKNLSKKAIIENEIESIINTSDKLGNKDASLPDTLSIGNVSYYEKTNSFHINFFILGLFFSIFIFIYSKRDLENKLKIRNQQLLNDYPEIISKLLLLCNSGLTIQKAFIKIYEDHINKHTGREDYAYDEIKYTINAISSGVSQSRAYTDMGQRCMLFPYIKLGSILEQNLKKGSLDMKHLLREEVQNSFENKKTDLLQKGNKASSKLLIPMIMMLILIMLLIIVPSFSSVTL